GVSFEDRQDLLGHKSGRITTYYSKAELENLIAAANLVCGSNSRKTPALVTLRKPVSLRLVAK
ncbi:MAG: site-specific integrase, partial [Pseudomonadota bacterium]